jgi:hypothetical protein
VQTHGDDLIVHQFFLGMGAGGWGLGLWGFFLRVSGHILVLFFG